MFPVQAELLSVPDSEYARMHMNVGGIYTVFGTAGSCYEVSTNCPGDKALVGQGRFKIIPEQSADVL